MTTRRKALKGLAAAISVLLAATPLAAQQSVEEFYQGRTIDMVIGYSPGGGYDQYARLVARHIGRFIPGNPEVVPRNMPGAGGRLAAAYIHDVAAQDGSVLGIAEQTLAIAQLMGDPTLTIDARNFNYIGSPAKENNLFITWHDSGVTSIEQARELAIPIGATGSTSSTALPRMMNELLGTQFEVIAGYPGGNDINFAMESGEVAGRAGANWASLRPMGWFQDGLVNIIVQIGLEPEPDLPQDIPLLYEFAENEEDLQLLRVYSAANDMGRPVMTTPNVPQDRVEALRDAFDQMIVDPEFIAAADAENLALRPSSGAELEELVDEILSAPPEIGERLGELSGIGG